jgi:hypothetical protein
VKEKGTPVVEPLPIVPLVRDSLRASGAEMVVPPDNVHGAATSPAEVTLIFALPGKFVLPCITRRLG